MERYRLHEEKHFHTQANGLHLQTRRDIFVGDKLLDILKKWQALQKNNEADYVDTYVHIYRTADDVIVYQSKGADKL